ncbi:MAG: FixH family protein [Thermodesulfobacteriota bacterium]
MEVWKCFLGLALSFFVFVIPDAFSHTDPPLMNLTMDPQMPAANEEVKIRIHLKGSNLGAPVLGAKIKIVLTNESGKQFTHAAQRGNKGGEYLGTISFPQKGMWKVRVDVTHRNELDFRQYMVRVMESNAGPHQVMTDETLLRMDKMLAHQLIPPQIVLEGYILLILLLLATVTVIKRLQRQT